MMETSNTVQHKQSLGFALFVLVLSLYLFTYRGESFSKDTIFIFDSMESFVHRGDMTRNYGFHEHGLFPAPVDGSSPFPPPNQEPLGIILSTPLFFVAQYLPDVGIMHIVWFFNIFMTAFTVLSFYLIAIQYGHSIKTAWFAALLFGIGTIAWWYSRLLFRETSMALFVLWAYASAMKIHSGWERNTIEWRAIGLFALMTTLALITKSITIFLLPAFTLIIMPPLSLIIKHWRRIAALALLGAIALLIVFVVMSNSSIGRRYDLANFDRLRVINWEFVIESILGYQIGVSRSVWLYSPVLFIGMWGAGKYMKIGKLRLVAAPLISLFLFSLWYGISLRIDWPGGWGWGPRYMLPILPMLMFWLLPALEYTFTKGGKRAKSSVGIFAGLGVFVQLLGMSEPLSNYYTDLFRADKIYDFSGYVESKWHWMAGNWRIEWSPIYYHFSRFLERLHFDYIDVGWLYANPRGTTVTLILLLLVLSIFMSRRLFQNQIEKITHYGFVIATALLVPAIIVTGLLSLRKDPRYIQGRNDLYHLAMHLDEIAEDDDIIFLDRFEYRLVFMNYFKSQATVVTLPYSPAEKYGPEIPPVSLDDPISDQIGPLAAYALEWSSIHYDDLWLLASTSPFDVDKRRPIERYLAEHYYEVTEIIGENNLRAIRFLTVNAPQTEETSIESNVVFGEVIRLIGADISGDRFAAGDVLPISLLWQPVDSIERDYNIGIYLIDSSGTVRVQRDGLPQATFGHTSIWELDETYRDNHGLLLPEDLPEGEYTLAIAVYNWQDGHRLSVISANGDDLGNTLNATTITIQ